jgi:hypothetical protein
MDDVRIYSRALSAEEIASLYSEADKTAPAAPTNLSARAASPSEVEVRWNLATDNARVTGYQVARNGEVVGVSQGRLYRDVGLLAGTSYEYTIQTIDVGGNISAASDPITVTTLDAGAPTEIIVDDADGSPHVVKSSGWVTIFSAPGYFGVGNVRNSPGDTNAVLTLKPVLTEPGEYDVYLRYAGSRNGFPYPYQMETSVPVDIISGVSTNTVSVNQQTNYGVWNLLGRFQFEAGTNSMVRIRTSGTKGYVLADAIRFVK